MGRKTITDLAAWPSLTLEGNLIAPAMVAQISQPKDDNETQQSYGVRKGLTIREEISTAFRVGQSHFDAFSKLQNPSADATRRFVRDFLKETFGFDDLVLASGSVAFVAGGRVPLVIVPPEEKLDRRSPSLSIDRSRSPAVALQDYLNAEDNALWGLVTNGNLIRLMRDNASLTRPAYIEADLVQIFTTEDAASFAALWVLIHRSRFGFAGTLATDCALERWREAGSKEGEAARDRLAGQVQLALSVLGSGFLEANPDLASALKSGEVNLTDWFNELLRFVYRMIFLMVAEDRNLLHPEKAKPEARKLYAEGYGLTVLRTQCVRKAAWDRHYDRYEGIKIVFRGLAAGQDALALPALGGLFSEDKLPHLEAARLRNCAFLEALFRLAWLSEGTGMVPVNWRAMETEELGSVYETLLELQPQLGVDGKTLDFASETAEKKGNQRKTSGSYYTPDGLVQALLNTALDPVLEKTEAMAADPAEALLKLSIVDPACGSGHFLLAAARRIATRLARIRSDGTPSLADYRHALRDVARCCIHGVDRNPMAVELAKVALWIETVDPGLPLGFFDAQIRCGDSLLGVFDLAVLGQGIPDEAYRPLVGDDKDIASIYRKINAAAKEGQGGFDFGSGINKLPETKPLAVSFSGFRALPEGSIEQISAKATRYSELRDTQAFAQAKLACDVYVSAFLLPKNGGEPTERSQRTIPTTEELWIALNQGRIQPSMRDVPKVATQARAFHWPLEFPDIMQRGGFDVVLGNPPWDKIQPEENKFFAALRPDIANEQNAKIRKSRIEALSTECPPLLKLWKDYTHKIDATCQYIKSSNVLRLSQEGNLNSYRLFTELSSSLISRHGSAGLVVQTGLATDETGKELFASLLESGRLKQFLDFENRNGFFPDIDSRMRFALITLGALNSDKASPSAEFGWLLHSLDEVEQPERTIMLTPADLALFNPSSKTCPVFPSSRDFAISRKIYESGQHIYVGPRDKIGDIECWGEMFNMTRDSGRFHAEPQDGFIPLYEAKFIHQFDHRFATAAQGDARELTSEEKKSTSLEITPRSYVDGAEVVARCAKRNVITRWLAGFRSISSPTNERTAIFSVFPFSAVGNSINLVLGLSAIETALLMANVNSLVFDYCARQKISGSNVNIWIFKQLPAVPFAWYDEKFLWSGDQKVSLKDWLLKRILLLAYTAYDLKSFAKDCGYDGSPFIWDDARRTMVRAELDALYAYAYDLSRDELRYILDPADVKGVDYPFQTFPVLKEREIRQFGEYRTRRLVLEAWDRMEADGTFAALGLAAEIEKPAARYIRVQVPPLDQLPDGAWSRAQPSALHDPGAALAAILKLLDGPTPIRTVRLVAAMMLEPYLLTPFLPKARAAHWLRLVGQEAVLRTGNVVGFVGRTKSGWGTSVTSHRGNSRLVEESNAKTWAPGPGLEAFETSGWPDGRAAFVLDAVRNLNIETTITSLPGEIRGWIADAATA